MSAIYSQATRVIVWLGPETKSSGKAISFLKRMNDGSVEILKCDRAEFKEDWEPVSEFCKIQYWIRLWIIQEIMLASEVILYCGPDDLTGNTISNTRDALISAKKICVI
jgi:hypothetical protein